MKPYTSAKPINCANPSKLIHLVTLNIKTVHSVRRLVWLLLNGFEYRLLMFLLIDV